MTLLDAYALVAFLVGGPAAQPVRDILRSEHAAIATANLAEALDVSQRVFGVEIERALALLDPLLEGPLTPVPLDLETAERAALLRATHYHRTRCPISLADAVLLASARAGDRVASSDPDLLAVAARERVETITLPEQGAS